MDGPSSPGGEGKEAPPGVSRDGVDADIGVDGSGGADGDGLGVLGASGSHDEGTVGGGEDGAAAAGGSGDGAGGGAGGGSGSDAAASRTAPPTRDGASSRASGERKEAVRVLLRCRPLTDGERKKGDKLGAPALRVGVPGERSVSLNVRGGEVQCDYDHVFGPKATQAEVFEQLSPSIAAVTEGINCTVFAYGQTGTGKTHTMLGKGVEKELAASDVSAPAWGVPGSTRWGVIPRAVSLLVSSVEEARSRKAKTGSREEQQVTVHCSYLQIYNEKVYDLLLDSKQMRALPLREHDGSAGKEVFVSGLSEYRVSTVDDVMALLAQGSRKRAVRATEYNEASSRSHAILQLNVTVETRKPGASRKVIRRAKLNLVDLAGSEKWDTSRRLDAGRTKELTAINKSLSALGNCIQALTEKRRAHIPYRDSALTRLLQDSLGGNTRTIIVATVSPSAAAAEESASTMAFADRARQIMVNVRANEVVDDTVLLARARREVARLRKLLQSQSACTCGGVRTLASAPTTDMGLHRVGSRRSDSLGRLSRPGTRSRAMRLKADVREAAALSAALDSTSAAARGASSPTVVIGDSPPPSSLKSAQSRRRRRPSAGQMSSPPRPERRSSADATSAGIAMPTPIRPPRAESSSSLQTSVEAAMAQLVDAVAAVVDGPGAEATAESAAAAASGGSRGDDADGSFDGTDDSTGGASTPLRISVPRGDDGGDDAEGDDGGATPLDGRAARRMRYAKLARPTTSPVAQHKAKLADPAIAASLSPVPAKVDPATERRIGVMQDQLRVLTTQSLELVRLLEEEEAKNEDLASEKRAVEKSEQAAINKRDRMAAQLGTMATQNKELCALLEEEETRTRELEARIQAMTDEDWGRSGSLDQTIAKLKAEAESDKKRIKELEAQLMVKPAFGAGAAGSLGPPIPSYTPHAVSSAASPLSSYSASYGGVGHGSGALTSSYSPGKYASAYGSAGAGGAGATVAAPLTSYARLDYAGLSLRGGAGAGSGAVGASSVPAYGSYASAYLSGSAGMSLRHSDPGRPAGTLGASGSLVPPPPSSLVSVPGFAPTASAAPSTLSGAYVGGGSGASSAAASYMSYYSGAGAGAASGAETAPAAGAAGVAGLGTSSSLPSLSSHAEFLASLGLTPSGAKLPVPTSVTLQHSSSSHGFAVGALGAVGTTASGAHAVSSVALPPATKPAAYDFRQRNVDSLASSYSNITFTDDSAVLPAALAPSAAAPAGAAGGGGGDSAARVGAKSPAAPVEEPAWMRGSSIIYEDASMAAEANSASITSAAAASGGAGGSSGTSSFSVPPADRTADALPHGVQRRSAASPAVAGMDRPLDSRASLTQLGLGITTPRRGQDRSPSITTSPLRPSYEEAVRRSGSGLEDSSAGGTARADSPSIFGLTSADSDEEDVSGNPVSPARRARGGFGADASSSSSASRPTSTEGASGVALASSWDAAAAAEGAHFFEDASELALQAEGGNGRAHAEPRSRRPRDRPDAEESPPPPPPRRQRAGAPGASPSKRKSKGVSPSSKSGGGGARAAGGPSPKRRSNASKSTAAAANVYATAVPAHPRDGTLRPGAGSQATAHDIARDALAAAARALG